MKKRNEYLIYGLAAVFGLWFLYWARSATTPFILAAAFAYLLNPFVSLITRWARLPRDLSIVLIYVAIIGLLGTGVVFVTNNLNFESEQFSRETRVIMRDLNSSIADLPGWLQPVVSDSFESIRGSLLYPQKRIAAFLPGAVNRTIGILVFLVASFYFLRDGQRFVKAFFRLFPQNIASEVEEIIFKINGVLGNYLRGQLLLVAIMSTLTFIGLMVIGVRYALILSIFTGLAEIIPFIGPIVAASVAMIVAFADQISRFNFVPAIDLFVVAALYFVLRQLEDLFIIPVVLGRLTKLHPLVVMFSVLAGGHLFGLMGYLAAVPVIASVKVVWDHIKALQDS